MIVPCYDKTSSSARKFCLAPLSNTQAVIYVGIVTSCSSHLLSALYKMKVNVCLQNDFKYVKHEQIFSHIKQLNTNNVLDAIYSQSQYSDVAFSISEAKCVRKFLQSIGFRYYGVLIDERYPSIESSIFFSHGT